jgi:Holliday junction DNA helicase RuvA
VIARLAGTLEQVTHAIALIDGRNGLWYEVLCPVFDLERLGKRVGQEVLLHTIHYIEGDPSHGVVTPRLIGFVQESDRDFFRLYTTVKGIGVRKALRSLVRPTAEVAAAIQAKDTRFLVELPEIGKRTAEQIIAELHGKVDVFAGPAAVEPPTLSAAAEEALAVLVQLGERRADALALVERVAAVAGDLDTPEAIIQAAYRLKAGGRS